MTSIPPDNADPLSLRNSNHGMSALVVRFAGWLFLAVMLLALVWSR
jgi:hypothetical protein